MNCNCIKNRELISNFSSEFTRIPQTQIKTLLEKYYDVNAIMYLCHPFNVVEGIDSMLEVFYNSFLNAFDIIEDTQYHVMSDIYKGEEWVSQFGCFKVKFISDWIGIKANQSLVNLHYGAFHRIKNGKIVETRMLIDLLELLYKSNSKQLLRTVPFKSIRPLKMAFDLSHDYSVATYDHKLGLEQSWENYEENLSEKFVFHSFSGFGSIRSKTSYLKQIYKPFINAHKEIRHGRNNASILTEGACIAMTGWPGIEAVHYKSGWLGTKATKKQVNMRVMEWWFFEAGKIQEKWVLIDQIDYLLQLGIDVLDMVQSPNK